MRTACGGDALGPLLLKRFCLFVHRRVIPSTATTGNRTPRHPETPDRSRTANIPAFPPPSHFPKPTVSAQFERVALVANSPPLHCHANETYMFSIIRALTAVWKPEPDAAAANSLEGSRSGESERC